MNTTPHRSSAAGETGNQTEAETSAEVLRIEHDRECPWPISTTLVLALSDLTGMEPTAMLPLNRAVHPDVLEHLVDGRVRGSALTFEHHGYRITVNDDGKIQFVNVNGHAPTLGEWTKANVD